MSGIVGSVASSKSSGFTIGVLPSGKIDDTDVLRIEAAALVIKTMTTGGTIKLSDGEFNFSRGLLTYNTHNLGIYGSGRGKTVIKPIAAFLDPQTPAGATPAGIINFVACNNTELKSLTINKQANNVQANGATWVPNDWTNPIASRCIGVTCEDVEVISTAQNNQYEIWSLCAKNFNALNNWIYCNGDPTNGSLDQQAIELFGCDGFNIRGNHIFNCSAIAISIQSIAPTINNSSVKGGVITGNVTDGCRYAMAFLPSYHSSGACDIEDIDCFGNQFRNIEVGAIHITPATGNSSTPPKVRNLHIVDNVFRFNPAATFTKQYFVLLDMGALAANDVLFNNVSICDNEAYEAQASATSHPVGFIKVHGIKFSNNKVLRKTALKAFATGGIFMSSCDDMDICDNTIDGTRYYSMQIQGCTNFRVITNKFRNYNQAGIGTAAIMFDGTASSDFTLFGNDFRTTNTTSMGSLINFGGLAHNRWKASHNYGLGVNVVSTYALSGTATNGSRGTATITAATSVVVNTQMCTASSVISVVQTSGTPVAFTVAAGGSSFTITVATSGTYTFAWSID